MQYATNIHIRVADPQLWLKFKKIKSSWINWADNWNESFSWEEYAEKGYKDYIDETESGGGCTEDELYDLIEQVADAVGNKGVVIATTYNINVDGYEQCYYYLGGHTVHDRCFNHDRYWGIYTSDIAQWLTARRFWPDSDEEKVLLQLGVSYNGNHYDNFDANFQTGETIYLRETGFSGRPEIIEKVSVGDEVILKPAPCKEDKQRLEAFTQVGSIGYLPSQISDNIEPLVKRGRFNFKVTVAKVTPLSKRNPFAKSPIVTISLQ